MQKNQMSKPFLHLALYRSKKMAGIINTGVQNLYFFEVDPDFNIRMV